MVSFKNTSLRYTILKQWIKFGLHIYFRDIEVHGREHIPVNVPVIFAVNHPNTVLDALLTSCFVKQQPWFMARGDVFRWKIFAWLFRTLRMLPIYREMDGHGKVRHNATTFELSSRILGRGGSLIMFPEGSHNRQWRIRDMRRGVARIAESASAKNPELVIIPVGITYFDPLYSFSDVLVQFGEPIKAASYFTGETTEHKLDRQKKLVNDIGSQLEKLTLHLSQDHYEEVYQRVKSLEHNAPETNSLLEDFLRLKKWIEACEADSNYGKPTEQSMTEQIKKKTFPALALFATAPLWLMGKAFTIVPQLSIWATTKKLKDDHYSGAIRFGMGIVIYTLLFFSIGLWSYLSTITLFWFLIKWAFLTFCLFFVMLWEEHFDNFLDRRFNRD